MAEAPWVESYRASVRPTVTIGLVIAFCIAAFVNVDAAKIIAGITGTAMGYWFSERKHRKDSAGA